MITSDPDRIRERGRLLLAPDRRDVLLEDRELRLDAAGFPDIGVFRQAVRLVAHHVSAQPQPRPPGPAVGTRCLGLQPVEERKAELPRSAQVPGGFLRSSRDEVSQQVVVLWPVHHRDPAAVRTSLEPARIEDAAIEPEIERTGFGRRDRACRRDKGQLPRLQGARVRVTEGKKFPRPRRIQVGHEIPPESIVRRTVDAVVLSRKVVDREAPGRGLDVVGIRLDRRVRFARLRPGLAARHKLGPRQGKKVAVLGGIDEVGRRHRHILPATGLECDAPHPVAIDLGPGRGGIQQKMQFAA